MTTNPAQDRANAERERRRAAGTLGKVAPAISITSMVGVYRLPSGERPVSLDGWMANRHSAHDLHADREEGDS